MVFSQSDIDALKRSIALGEKSVQFADRTIIYRGIAEMIQALRLMEGEVAATRPAKQFLGYATKGL